MAQPSWGLYLTMSVGASNLVVSQWQLDSFDAAGVRVTTSSSPPISTFASSFNFCGPGSSRVLAQTDACGAPCISLGAGRTSGFVQVSFTATDDDNRTVTFSSPRVTLSR